MLSNSIPAKWTPYILSLTRIVVGFNLMRHGTIRLFGYPTGDPVPWLSLSGAAGVVESFGGLLALAGLFAQPVALILAAEMAIVYLTTNLPRGFWTSQNGGDAWSLDNLLSRKRTAARSAVNMKEPRPV